MKRGDIYLVTLDPTEGREQQGNRSVLVVSPQAFNEATKSPGIVLCDQPRVLDIQQRKGQKVDTLPPEILAEVLARLVPIFE